MSTLELMESRVLFSAFANGDVAVLDLAAASNNTTGSVLELNPSTANQATPVQTVSIPSTGTSALRFSDSGTSSFLSLTGDRTLLAFGAYNSTNASLTDLASLTTAGARAVGTVDGNTNIALQTTYTESTSGNQTRSATSTDNAHWYITDKGGLFTNSATASSIGNLNILDARAFGGSVYIASTKTALSTASSPTASSLTALPGLATDAGIQDFYLIQSGNSGTSYDLLYTLDAGGAINKFSLVNGTWQSNGSYTLSGGGLSLIAANNGSGGASLYAVTATGPAGNSVVKLTDTTGFNTTINVVTANNVTLFTAGSTDTLKGLDFAPKTSAPTPSISSVSVNPNVVAANANSTISLSAVVTETGGAPSSVSFYREAANGTENISTDTVVAGTATNSGGTWSLSNVSTTGLGAGTYTYYAVATDSSNGTSTKVGSIPSASLTVIQPASAVTLQPISHTVAAGGSVTFTAAATGSPAPTAQWQVSSNGGATWSNVAATTTTVNGLTTTTTYTLSSVSEQMTGEEFQVIFSNTSGPSATTNPATLIVSGTPIAQWAFTSGIGAPAAGSTSQGTGNSPYPTFGPLTNGATILGLNNDFTGVQSYPEADIIPLVSSVNSNYSAYVWRIRAGSGLGPTGGPGKPDGWSQNAPEYANVDGSGQPLNVQDVQGVQFNVNTTGYSHVTLHFDWDQGGIADMQPQYFDSASNAWINVPGNSLITATGSDYYGIAAGPVSSTNPVGVSVNLQGVSAANNNPNFQFRLVAAYNSTLPAISDGNALDPAVHGQYASGAPGLVSAQQVLQFNSGIADGETVPLTYSGYAGAAVSFAYSSTPATLIANLTAALTTLYGAGNFSVLPTNYTSTTESSATLLQPVRDALGIQGSDMTVTFKGALAAKDVPTMTTTDNTHVTIATWVKGSTSGFQPFVDGGGSWELANISFNGDSTVTGGLGITANPASASQAASYPVTFTSTAYSETTPVAAQWQVQLPSQQTWSNVANDGTGSSSNSSGIDISASGNAYTSTYTFNTLSDQSQNGYHYRCVFTTSPSGQSAGSVSSQPALLTVVTPAAPAVVLNPVSQSVVAGYAATFNATTTGSPTPTVQWQFLSAAPGAVWQNLADANGSVAGSQTNTLQFTTAADGSQNNYQFRAVFTNGIGSMTSSAATLTVLTAETNITNWDFNQYTSGTFTNSPAPTGGAVGVGSAIPIGFNLPYNPSDPATGTDGTGSVAGADVTSPNPAIFYQPGGVAYTENTWRIRGQGSATGNTGSQTQNGWSNFAPQYTQGAEFDVPTTGYNNIFVTLDWFSTHSGELDAQRQYTLDGTNWINLGAPIQDAVQGNDDYYGDSATGIAPVVFDVSKIPGSANDPHFGVRLVNSYNVYLSNVQTIELADNNSFTLNTGAGTQNTATIPGSASVTDSGLAAEASAIQSALGALPAVGGAGNVSVTGYISTDGANKPEFTITFGGSLTTIVPTLVASDSTINQNITHSYLYANAQEVGSPTVPAPYNGSKGNWRLDNIEVHGTAIATAASVVGRSVFYNNSYFDGNDPAANSADDGAIASDKSALLPGQTAAFANYTSYSKGINGMMVDVSNLAGTPTAADFSFTVGNDNNPSAWASAPAPSSIVVRPGAGIGGSNRIEITWADGAIQKEWLQVKVLADAATGLASPDVFYFGNAPGDSGNSTTDAYVDGTDFAGARDNQRNFLNRAPINFNYDYNRDSFVDGTDIAIARDNNTNFLTVLKLITPPAGGSTLTPSLTAATTSQPPLLTGASSTKSPTTLASATPSTPITTSAPATPSKAKPPIKVSKGTASKSQKTSILDQAHAVAAKETLLLKTHVKAVFH